MQNAKPAVRYFGDYELLEEIARGGMGIVYKARQVSLNRIVALKMLLFGKFSSDEFVRRFRAEAEAAASLQHPHIVAIHEVGEYEGQHYFSMDYVEGKSLAEVAQEKPVSARQAAIYVRVIAEAAHYAHERGILHRDLKPSNVLINQFDQLRVTDFGLAKRLRGDSDLTLTGQMIGSPNYMPPEQAEPKRGHVSPASDVYSLGAILYCLLTGRPPFIADTLEKTLEQLLHREPVVPRLLNPSIPRDLETICLKCLSKDPERRYNTASALAQDLERWLKAEPIVARPTSWPERLWRWCRRQPKLAGLLAAILLLLLSVAIGSSVVAVRLRRAGEQVRKAKDDATEKLWGSYLTEARARRTSGVAGQRFDSLEAVKKAAAIRPAIEVRNEAIACLAVPDLSWHKQAAPEAAGPHPLVRFDSTLERYVVARETGDLSFRSVADDHEIALLSMPAGMIGAIHRFSPDGRFLQVLYQKRLGACVWDVEHRKVVLDGVPWGDFTSDSRFFAGHRPDGVISFYDLASGLEARRLALGRVIGVLAFSPDGSKFAGVRMGSPTIDLYEFNSGRTLQSLQAGNTVVSLAWSADGKFLAGGANDSRVYVWSVEDAKLTITFQGHSDDVISVAFSPRDNLLASSSLDESTRLWSLSLGREVVRFGGCAYDIHFGPDDLRLAFAQQSPLFGLLTAATSTQFRRLTPTRRTHGHSGPDFSPDGRIIAAGSDERVWFWDVSSGKEIGAINIAKCEATWFHADGRSFITAEKSGFYSRHFQRLSDSSRCAYRLGAPSQIYAAPDAREAVLSRDGRHLAVVSSHLDGESMVLDLEAPSSRVVLGKHPLMDHIAISPDSHWAATASYQNSLIMVWDARSGSLATTLPMPARAVAYFSPDGRWLATASTQYQLWEVGTWRPRNPPIPGQVLAHLNSIAFNQDGSLMAIVQEGRTILLLETSTGRPVAKLEAPDADRIGGLRFSPDGSRLAALEWDQELQLWDLRALRQSLKTMQLDWDLPPYPPVEEPVPAPRVSLEMESEPLSGTDRSSEASDKDLAAVELTPRDPRAEPGQIDLSLHYTGRLDWNYATPQRGTGCDLEALPRGLHKLGGIDFDIRGMIQLRGLKLNDPQVPEHTSPIRISQKLHSFHFLHGTGWSADEGTVIASYLVHYADGNVIEIPVVYGQDLREWIVTKRRPRRDLGRAIEAWSAPSQVHGTVRVFLLSWENPRPDLEVASLEVFSKMTECTPFLIAVTVQ